MLKTKLKWREIGNFDELMTYTLMFWIARSRAGNRPAVINADSTYDENDKTGGPIRDKKFEGYSNLKGAPEKMKQRAHF